MVKRGSVLPDGVPTFEGTSWDLMMHVSPLLVHVLSTRRIAERITSAEGMSVPYICKGSKMAHAGNNVLIVHNRIAHN